MEAFKTKGSAKGGILCIAVPKEFEEKELEVIVLSTNEETDQVIQEEKNKQHKAKVERLTSIVGSARYPDFPITKFDVYDQ
jgi:hypothetical protein